MPEQPTDAMLAAARAYALSTWTYDPADYRSPQHRDVHVNADARGTAQAPWFVALWEAGIAEGRRQATEGWEREWAVSGDGLCGYRPASDEAGTRAFAADRPHLHVVSRLAGRWEPADPPQQPEPARGVGWRLARDEEIQPAAEQGEPEEARDA